MADSKPVTSAVDSISAGKALKHLREGLNLDATDVRTRTGITPQRLGKIEEGRDVTLEELGLLAAAYDYTPGGITAKITRKT